MPGVKPGECLLPACAPAFDEVGRLLLPLREDDFGAHAQAVELNGRRFIAKTEHHITLVGSELAARIGASPAARCALIEYLGTRASVRSWRYRLDPGYLLIGKEPPADDLSIVVMVTLSDADALYSVLDGALGEPVPRPPLHVTLYTAGNARGIALASAEVLAARLRTRLKADWLRA